MDRADIVLFLIGLFGVSMLVYASVISPYRQRFRDRAAERTRMANEVALMWAREHVKGYGQPEKFGAEKFGADVRAVYLAALGGWPEVS